VGTRTSSTGRVRCIHTVSRGHALQLACLNRQGFTPDWFELDTTLLIESDTKLLFSTCDRFDRGNPGRLQRRTVSVNAADYTVYRNRKSGIGGTTLPNDAGAAGDTIDDYNYWKAHYGETGGSGLSAGDGITIPEPPTSIAFGLVIVALAALRLRSSFFKQS
jgi:hypothetical protein